MKLVPRLALALACAIPSACAKASRPGLPPQHLLLITVEGLRADHLSCYGYRRPTSATPSDETQRSLGRAMGLDDLAASGVLFAHAFAPSGSTTASLASLLTGRAPREAGVVDDRCGIASAVPGLASVLAGAGFETAAFATATALPLQDALGGGFERFVVRPTDAETIDAAVEGLRWDYGNGRPRFAWIHLAGPSAGPGSLLDARFVDPRRGGSLEDSPGILSRARTGEASLSAADRAHVVDLYDGGIASATEEIARLLSEVFDFHAGDSEGSEAWSRTLLVFASPHGVELFERGGFGHALGVHDAELRVPLFFRHPDSLTGERVMAELVELADVMPTVLEWLGLESPPGVSGRSLLPVVDTYVQRPFERRPAFAVSAERVYTARTPRWRLILNVVGARDHRGAVLPPVLLYDHEQDPLEQTDVAASHPEVVAEHGDRIRAYGVALVGRQRAPRVVSPAGR